MLPVTVKHKMKKKYIRAIIFLEAFNPRKDLTMQPMDTEMNQEQNLSQGYTICVEVLPDGFRVSEPMPLSSYSEDERTEAQPDQEDSALQPDIASALKQVMAVVQAHPVGQSEASAFNDAGAAAAE